MADDTSAGFNANQNRYKYLVLIWIRGTVVASYSACCLGT